MSVQVTSTITTAFLVAFLSGCATHPASSGFPNDPIVQHALHFQGVPYRYGGVTPKGFDCSGLVQYVYRKEGIAIPRTSRQQWRQAEKVARSDLLAGDLLFFQLPGKSLHVGIYVGQDQFIHAPSTGKTVRIDTLNRFWQRHFLGAGRYRHYPDYSEHRVKANPRIREFSMQPHGRFHGNGPRQCGYSPRLD